MHVFYLKNYASPGHKNKPLPANVLLNFLFLYFLQKLIATDLVLKSLWFLKSYSKEVIHFPIPAV